MTECPKCKRPIDTEAAPGWESCIRTGNHSCNIVAAAYHRGIARGVEIAKSNTYIGGISGTVRFMDWAYVDRAVAKEVEHVDA